MTTSAPLISVIVPCFNLGPYLEEAVESVLAQSYGEFEVIVVNDGSTDPQTVELLSTFSRPRTRVVTTEHGGLAHARNLGIAHASGKYLCGLDADDRLEPTYFRKAIDVLEARPEIFFASCWLETFGDETWVWRPEHCDLPTLLAECTVCTAALVHRSAVLAVGGYDERMPHLGYEDWDLWITLVERGYQGTILPEVLFKYRRRSGSMSTVCTVGDHHLELMRYLIEKHHASYDLHLRDVLARKDAEAAELLRSNHSFERHIESSLVPEVDRRRDELAALQHKLERARAERALREEHSALTARTTELAAALEMARREVTELRDSKSWRVTAPLRAIYGLIQRPRRN